MSSNILQDAVLRQHVANPTKRVMYDVNSMDIHGKLRATYIPNKTLDDGKVVNELKFQIDNIDNEDYQAGLFQIWKAAADKVLIKMVKANFDHVFRDDTKSQRFQRRLYDLGLYCEQAEQADNIQRNILASNPDLVTEWILVTFDIEDDQLGEVDVSVHSPDEAENRVRTRFVATRQEQETVPGHSIPTIVGTLIAKIAFKEPSTRRVTAARAPNYVIDLAEGFAGITI